MLNWLKSISERTWELIGIVIAFVLVLGLNVWITSQVYAYDNFFQFIGHLAQHYGLTSPFRGLWELFLILLFGCGAIIFISYEINPNKPFDLKAPWNDELDFLKAISTYWAWGFVQHIFLIGTLIGLEIINPGRQWNILFASFIFAFGMHRPNVFAVLTTFSIGIMSCMLFNEFHNIYLSAIIHGSFATVGVRFLPEALTTHLYIMSESRKDQKDLNDKLSK